MRPISPGVIALDERGTVTGLGGPVDRFGLPANAIGCNWQTFMAKWGATSSAPTLQSAPCCFHATGPHGEPLTVELVIVPAFSGADSFLALVRDEEKPFLTPQQEQLCGLGELTAVVAHEINNALTLLCGWLELLLADTAKDDPKRSTLELLASESERIGRITRNLLQVARGAQEEPHELDLRTLIDEVNTLVGYEMKSSNIDMEVRVASELPHVRGSAGRLKQALLNLLVNARQAMPKGGRVTVSAFRDDTGDVLVSVEDNGEGIPRETQPRIFSPFYTTKRNGTGLGLSVTRRIIEDHGGTVDLMSEAGAGAKFTMRFPVKQGAGQ